MRGVNLGVTCSQFVSEKALSGVGGGRQGGADRRQVRGCCSKPAGRGGPEAKA